MITLQFIWTPYTQAILDDLPDFCKLHQELHLAVVPLIVWWMVEWHHPDRVLRQFGHDQHIPGVAMQHDSLHDVKLSGRNEVNWAVHHAQYVEMWIERRQRVLTDLPRLAGGHLPDPSDYMMWYQRHTVRWMDPSGAIKGTLVSLP